MYQVKNGKYRQESKRIEGKVHSIYKGKTTDEKKQTAYEIATGDKIKIIDGMITELYISGLGVSRISKILAEEEGVKIGKNPITARLHEMKVYGGDRRNKSPVKIDHIAIEEENKIAIMDLSRQLERAEFRAETAEKQLADCRAELEKVRNDRNESDRKLRLIGEGIKVV